MRRAVSHYQESGATDPALVVAQVGDEPWDKAKVRSVLQNTASLDIFWLFVGFSRGKLALYKNLNACASATFTNVAFYDASKTPRFGPRRTVLHGSCRCFRDLDALINLASTRGRAAINAEVVADRLQQVLAVCADTRRDHEQVSHSHGHQILCAAGRVLDGGPSPVSACKGPPAVIYGVLAGYSSRSATKMQNWWSSGSGWSRLLSRLSPRVSTRSCWFRSPPAR